MSEESDTEKTMTRNDTATMDDSKSNTTADGGAVSHAPSTENTGATHGGSLRGDTPLGHDTDGHTRSDPDAGRDPYADADTVLKLSDVERAYGSELAVESIDLTVREGELLTLLGPSGCGKTTTLRLIAGLDTPTGGTVEVAGETVAGVDETGSGTGETVPPEERDVGMVFQEFALFPHLTVAENVAFGIQDRPEAEREERVAELLELVGLAEYGDRTPEDLSGGQRQRVALARSLAPEPDVLLLDEPFSNLDVRLRTRMREEVRRILKEAGVTAVSVTHDQEEALSISDRVAVVHDGRIEQVGRPETVFEHPESRFVAEFIGQASFLSGTFADGRVETGLGTFTTDMLQGLTPDYDGADVDVLVRPDDLRAVPVDERREAVGGSAGGSAGGDGAGGDGAGGDAASADSDGADDAAVPNGDAAESSDDAAVPNGDGVVVGREYTGPSFVYEVELDSGDTVRCEHNHASEFGLDRRVTVDLVADHTLAWYPTE
jgi:iron(III) transport system ATP-binding protein